MAIIEVGAIDSAIARAMKTDFDHEALRDFILSQMRQRQLSQREFAKLVGVSQPTIQRAVTFQIDNPPKLPTLEFLMKLSEATRTDLSALIALVIPGSGHVDGRTVLLMGQIARLPERKRDVAEIMLRGLLAESGKD